MKDVKEYNLLTHKDLLDMKCELRDILKDADPELKLYVKEMLDIMYNYNVSPYNYYDLVNGCMDDLFNS